MAKNASKAQVSENGRLSLPAGIRREMGLEKGGVVSLQMVDGRLQLVSVQQAIKRVQQLARETGLTETASVEDFLAWKRDEYARDDKKLKRS